MMKMELVLALIPPRNARVMFPTSQSADPVQLAAPSFSNPNQKEEDLTVLKSYLPGLKRHFWRMPGEAISRILENVRVCRNDHLWHPVIRHCTLWETGADCEHNIKLVSTSEKCQCLLFVWIFILLFRKYQTSFHEKLQQRFVLQYRIRSWRLFCMRLNVLWKWTFLQLVGRDAGAER